MNDGAEGTTLDRAYAAYEKLFSLWQKESQEL